MSFTPSTTSAAAARAPAAQLVAQPAAQPALRERVLQASRELLAEGGPAALSMREVARRSGVTHQAPYHHFPDKASIVAELVTQGFEELAGRLSLAHGPAVPGGREARRATLRAAAEAYLGFALDHPAVFRLMFRPELCESARFPQAREAAERARGELHRLVCTVHGSAADESLASLHWAHVHGLACLSLDGPLEHCMPAEAERRAHLRAATEHFVRMVLP
ncbi:MAG: TetR/AcrR family transcriptional regulator [Rubrivivax sp.]